jgi:5S rRNA maturation endonuclease (ribonuclease M5)
MQKNDPEMMRGWLEKLKETEKIIIVEGLNDIRALAALGVPDHKIMALDTELYLFSEKVAERSKKAIILTDLDNEGKKLYRKLKSFLTKNGVEVDNYFREFLFKNSDLSHIEGIDTYFRRLLHAANVL